MMKNEALVIVPASQMQKKNNREFCSDMFCQMKQKEIIQCQIFALFDCIHDSFMIIYESGLGGRE